MSSFRRKNILVFSLLIMVNASCSMIIQGDILMSTGAKTKSDPSMSSGVQLADATMLWPEGKVYYRFDDPGFQDIKRKEQVRDMMDYIEIKLNGCTTFHEVFNSDSDHVLITSRGCGGQPGNKCYAHVGRQGGIQCLNLDQACMFNNTIVHELLHTMGFLHEHVRPDRDQFLTVITENIQDGAEHNFKKRERGSSRYFEAGDVDTYETPFDLMSVLLYPPSQSYQFSKDGENPTLKYKVPIIPSWPEFPPEEEPLTVIDTVEVALAYSCALEQQQMIDYININRIASVQIQTTLEKTLTDLSNNNKVLLEREMDTLETRLTDLSNNNKVLLEGEMDTLEEKIIYSSNNEKVLLEGEIEILQTKLIDLSNNNKVLLEGEMKTLERKLIYLSNNNKVLLKGEIETLQTKLIDLSNNNKVLLEGEMKFLETKLIDLSNNHKVLLEGEIETLQTKLIDLSNNNKVLLKGEMETLETKLIDLSDTNKILLEGKMETLKTKLQDLSNNNKVLLEGEIEMLKRKLIDLSNNNKVLLEGEIKTLETKLIDLSNNNKVLLEGEIKTLETKLIDLSNNNKDLEKKLKTLEETQNGVNKVLERKLKNNERTLIGLYHNNKVFQSVVNPEVVTVSSDDGPASQTQDSRMGVYKRDDDFNNQPMWSNNDGSQKIFYGSGGYWMCGDPSSDVGGIRSVKKGLTVLPVTGWQYYKSGTWNDDAQLTVSAGQPVYPHSIQVSSEGPAAGKQSSCMGQYNKIEGQQQNGRPTWKHSERDDKILFYADNHYWTIGRDPKKNNGGMYSVKKGLVNIPKTRWYYSDNGWHEDDKLEFL